MQKIILFLFLISFKIISAQNCAPNNITTNPAAPVNIQRPSMVNTFDWTQPDFPLNIRHNYNGNASIRSPFFDSDNSIINEFYDPIPGPKYFLPADGWELIKKDFGFEVGSEQVNNPFFILYNKYIGLLRVLIARGDQAFFNGAMVKVKFFDLTPMQTSLLDHSGELKEINAPFTEYPSLNSSSDILNGYEEWFYSDFPMNYDPCTCLFQSKLEIKIDLSNTSIISLSGTSNGEIVSQGEPSSSQSGKGSFSLGDVATGAKKIHETYKGIDGWANDLKSKPNANAGSIDNLKNEAKKSNFLKAGLGALPWIGSAIGLVDFFIGGGRKAPAGPQLVSVTPMSITMTSTYNGTISSQYPYSTISFRTPGSDPGAAADSEYPHYNEVLGILNLLYVPKINYTHVVTRYPAGCKGCYYYSYASSYRLAENISYVLNPAAKLEIQEIKAAIVIEAKNLGTTTNEGVNAITGRHQARFAYTDLGCLPTSTFKTGFTSTSTTISGPKTTFRRMYIKVTANLRRLDANDDTQNVLFVAIYPAESILVSSIPETSTCLTPLRQPETAATVQSYCSSPAYTGSSRFRKDKTYEELVSELEVSERLSAVNEVSNTFEFEVYPNPTQSNAEISYSLSQNSFVELSVINSLGQRKLILQEQKEAGTHAFNMNLSNHQAGIYLCELNVNGKRVVKKLIVE